jgi:hypothetical protein
MSELWLAISLRAFSSHARTTLVFLASVLSKTLSSAWIILLISSLGRIQPSSFPQIQFLQFQCVYCYIKSITVEMLLLETNNVQACIDILSRRVQSALSCQQQVLYEVWIMCFLITCW